MAHGYLGDGYGAHGEYDEDRDDDRERGWRGRHDEWRDRDRDSDRGMMFESRDRGWSEGGRWGERRRDHEQGGAERSFSASRDDHYRNWRDRHMSELDRDYEDYCREREQQFHQDFDSWRSQRHANHQPLQTGMTQTGMAHDPSGELQLTNEVDTSQPGSDPMGEATLGTTSRKRR